MSRKKEKVSPFHLKISFGEALERYAGAEANEIEAVIRRNKKKKPPRGGKKKKRKPPPDDSNVLSMRRVRISRRRKGLTP